MIAVSEEDYIDFLRFARNNLSKWLLQLNNNIDVFPKALSVLNNDVIPYTPPVDHDRMVNSSVFKSTNQSCLNRQTVIKLAKKSK